ncbi:hypothetical protein N7456_001237 [Penicillium angulare]|uniref:Uncharacterized protein n=1 Tax=Penicillium angulare TaxID=116970 RepID=A0A9W9GDM1_9EURO|nr:hypothetical protein N7456_001237 [Penicillium angulare]
MHSFILSGAALLASLASLSNAAAINTTEHNVDGLGDQWARFCNDDACSEGCGTWVDMSNAGCLTESGRGSFEVKGSAYGYTIMVESADASCPCQTDCMDGSDSNGRFSIGCHAIDGDFGSFRFLGDQPCPANNC